MPLFYLFTVVCKIPIISNNFYDFNRFVCIYLVIEVIILRRNHCHAFFITIFV